jgi:hypothetical protein
LHAFAQRQQDLRLALARHRRIGHQQQVLINWLLPPDQSPLETTIAYEQVAIEVTASLAQHEPDPYLQQQYRFALLDRLEGKDPNNILQSYTDVRPGRPTLFHHRAPVDDLRRPYDRSSAAPISKLNALTIVAGEFQTRDYYMNVGPLFADPVARGLYAEISLVEEQHVTEYESLIDPGETLLEKWLLWEATEVYNFWSCLRQESNARVKQIWETCLAHELGQLHAVAALVERVERRDPWGIVPKELPDPIDYSSHRAFVRDVLEAEVHLRSIGEDFVEGTESAATRGYRARLTAEGSFAEPVSTAYRWAPGTELFAEAQDLHRLHGGTP